MTQISNTNSPLLFRPKSAESGPICAAVKHDSAAMPTAARPIPLQYASPPVDLVRMLFIVPQTNRIADEHLNYTAFPSHLSKDFLAPGSLPEPNTSPTVVCFIPGHCCESLDRRLESCLFASLCAVTRGLKGAFHWRCVWMSFAVTPLQWRSKGKFGG